VWLVSLLCLSIYIFTLSYYCYSESVLQPPLRSTAYVYIDEKHKIRDIPAIIGISSRISEWSYF
jgi:hypothetical protein